jgi:hypothetical protein
MKLTLRFLVNSKRIRSVTVSSAIFSHFVQRKGMLHLCFVFSKLNQTEESDSPVIVFEEERHPN